MIRLFLLFTVVPALEVFLLLQVGSLMGALPTFLLIVVTGAVGAYLARHEGTAVLGQLRDDLQQGIPPASRVVEGALVVAGGLLLVTPGMLTDIVGFSLVLPATRTRIAPQLLAALSEYGREHSMRVDLGSNTRYREPERTPSPKPPFDHPVA